MPTPERTPESGTWKRRYARLAVKISLVLIASALLFEGALRVLLFSGNSSITRIASEIRSPGNFAHRCSTQYWKLRYTFSDPATRKPPANIDKRTGWRMQLLSAEGYRHAGIAELGQTRPLLLYGDSYAETTSLETTWSSLLAASQAGAGLTLLNYGTGGFGLDQIFLTYMLSIDTLQERNPIVVVSILADNDLDRVNLGFRGWPKPRLHPDSKGLDFSNGLGLEPDPRLEANPLQITSYAWRYLVHGSGLLSANSRNQIGGRREAYSDTRHLCRRILNKLNQEFLARKQEAFVLLFHGKGQVTKARGEDWPEAFLIRELNRLGIPFVSTRTDLELDFKESGRKLGAYLARSGKRKGHYTVLGNEVTFKTLERGLRGQFDGKAQSSLR